MRGALIHGVLLAVMLVYGYRTWTRDKTVQPNVGSVVLWDKNPADLVSIEYRSPKKIVKLERKPEGYWWGSDTTIETKLKPPKATPDAAGSAAGSADAGSAADPAADPGAGTGSAAPEEPPTIEEEETGQKVREFPLGEAGEKVIQSYASARALRDLGKPSDAAKKDYKLGTKPTNTVTMKDGKEVSTTTITVTFKDGSRSFLVGGSVYGGADKYVMDQQSGKAYVLAREMLSSLEIGQSSLQLTDPRGFDATKIASVALDAGGKTKSFARITTSGGPDGSQQVKTWGDPATKKADQTAANFIDNANNLRPTEYLPTLKVADLTPVMKLTYKDERGALLGTLSLFKRDKPGELAEGQELDPANPPKGETEYYIVTEKTRVPAIVRKDTAQRAENDIETVFSGKPAAPTPVDPKGNPFGNMPPGHGAMPGGHGAPPPPPPSPHGDAVPVPPADPHGHAPGAPDPHGHGAQAPGAGKPAAPAATKPGAKAVPAKPAGGPAPADAKKPTPPPAPPAPPAPTQ
jgi:hypothetical protein